MAPSPATDSPTTTSGASPTQSPATVVPSQNGADTTVTSAAAQAVAERRANFAAKNANSAFGQTVVAGIPPALQVHGRPSITAVERRRLSSRPFNDRRRTSVLVGQRSLDIMSELPSSNEAKAPRFVSFIIRMYRRWGYFIAEHDWQAIVICCIISAFAMVKIFTTP